MLHLNNGNFDSEISSHEKVVVDFWAPWCGPCRALGPIVEQVSAEIPADIIIAKVNIDEVPELAERFNVQSIPTIIFFKNGTESKRSVGLVTKTDIISIIEAL